MVVPLSDDISVMFLSVKLAGLKSLWSGYGGFAGRGLQGNVLHP